MIRGAATSYPTAILLNPVANGECGPWSDQNFGRPRLSTRNAPDSLEGFNKQFHNWQASVSFQHELTQGLALNVGYFRTWYGGFQATDNLAVSGAAHFDSYLHHGADRLPAAWWRWKSDLRAVRRQAGATSVASTTLVTQASNYGKQTQVYNGLDLTLNGRLAARRSVLRRSERGPDRHRQLLPQRQSVADDRRRFRNVFLASCRRPSIGRPAKLAVLSRRAAVVVGHAGEVPGRVPAAVGFRNERASSRTAPAFRSRQATSSQCADQGRARPQPGGVPESDGPRPATQTVRTELIPPNTMFEPRLTQVDLRVSRSVPPWRDDARCVGRSTSITSSMRAACSA